MELKSSSKLTLNNVLVNGSSKANILEPTFISVPDLKNTTKISNQFLSCSTLRGLVTKNLIKLTRNPSVLLMNVILPILWVLTVCLGFNKDPHDIPFGIVNDELKIMQENCTTYDQGDGI